LNAPGAQNRVTDLETAAGLVADDARIGIGGVLLSRKPMRLLAAVADRGTTGLRAYSFLASIDMELLAARGCLAEVHTGYVGLEQLGQPPAFAAGVDTGAISVSEYSELLFTAGVRAAAGGLPFFPTKGAVGSDVLDALGYASVADPYGGEEVVAVPAMRLDVAVIHAESADRFGNVVRSPAPDFLDDADANLCRAAERVVVTVERLVDHAEVVAHNRQTVLHGFEVDAVVVLPGGARPGALPGVYPVDRASIERYLAAVAVDPGAAGGAAKELVSW
jgi:glutaconate CoA-transferase subunit A